MRHNWLAVARKEVADASRSWLLYVLAGLLLAVFTVVVVGEGLTYDPAGPMPDTPHTSFVFSRIWLYAGVLLVPLVSLVVGYLAVAGEREAGSLRLLLGHPVTRAEVLAGKFLGRLAVVWATLGVALALAGVGIPPLFRGFDAGAYATLVALLLLEAGAFVGVAVGLSAAARSRAVAMAGAITTFAGTVFAWGALPLGLHYLAYGNTPSNPPGMAQEVPGWFVLLRRLRPQNALEVAQSAYVSPQLSGVGGSEAPFGEYAVQGGDPFFAEPWFAIVVLLAWAVVPLAVGYWRLRAADVG